MKKFIVSCLACLSYFHSTQALLPNFNESIAEYQAILNAQSLLATKISPSEFIIDIQRKTRNLDAETVFYEIVTTSGSNSCDTDVENNPILRRQHHHHHKTRKYLVKLTITPNPAIGPDIITVDSIEKKSTHSNIIFGTENEID